MDTPLLDHADEPHRGLALRYRPRRFAELTGQRHVTAILGRMVVRGVAPAQLLLSGGSGLGKTTVGRIYAAALLCETPVGERATGDACGRCPACDDVTATVPAHPDVIELDAASNGGKDEIRDIAARAAMTPLRGDRKVYIIDEVHALSGPGGQAFLKLLEEPPAHVVFVLCTTNPEKLSSGAGGAGTIRGRCLELELLRPDDEQLHDNLQRIAAAEGITLPDEVARQVVAATDPTLGVRGTVTTLEKITGALADGDVDDEDLALLLGAVPSRRRDLLVAAVAAGDHRGALAALADLRGVVADTAIRTALRQWVTARLDAALAHGGDPGAVLATLEHLATLPAGRHFTDVAVVRMCGEMPAAAAAAAAHPAATLDGDEVDQLRRELIAARDDVGQAREQLVDAEDLLAQLREELQRARVAVRALGAARRDAVGAAAPGERAAAGGGFLAELESAAGDLPPPPQGPDGPRAQDADVAHPDVPPPPEDPGDQREHLDESDHFEPPADELGEPPTTQAPPRSLVDAAARRGRDQASPKLTALLGQLDGHDARVAALVRRCSVTFPTGRAVLAAPDDDTAEQLLTAHAQGTLFACVRAVNVSRVVVRRPG